MIFNFKVEFDLFEELSKRLEALDGQEVSIGMFEEQGKHKDSGFTYAALLKYHADGNPAKNLPPRSPLHVAVGLNPIEVSPMRRGLNNYLKDLKNPVGIKGKSLLRNVGVFYRRKAREVFGNESLLRKKSASTRKASISPNTPLVETRNLARKMAYRVNKEVPKPINR